MQRHFETGLNASLTLLLLGSDRQRSWDLEPTFWGFPGVSQRRSRCVLAASPHVQRSGRSRCRPACRRFRAGRRPRGGRPGLARQHRRATGGAAGATSVQRQSQGRDKKKQRQNAGGIMGAEGSQAGAATIPGNLATDQSLLPQPPAPPPPLGGLGDEPAEPVPAVPGFGITEPNGAPLTRRRERRNSRAPTSRCRPRATSSILTCRSA